MPKELAIAVIEDNSSFRSALVEALSYIQRFHNKVVVVKVGGSIMDDETALTNLLIDIVFMMATRILRSGIKLNAVRVQ